MVSGTAEVAPTTGVNAGGRAALIGGADFTSNTGLSHVLGYPPKGTHAHSMVQAFIALGASELEAFRKFASLYPDECILLVDTIDVLDSGVPNAIEVFSELRASGHEPIGIRIDSGDLAYMTIQAAAMLDAAGFEGVSIVLSSDLDEMVISAYRHCKPEVITIPTNKPMRRLEYPDIIYRTEREKFNAVVEEIKKLNEIGQPALIEFITAKEKRASRL